MSDRQIVVLYGTTLFLASIAASLKDKPALEVVQVDAARVSETAIQSRRPDVVIVDGSDGNQSILPNVTRLVRNNPRVVVIGLDLASDQVTVLAGQQRSARNVAEVVEAIRTSASLSQSLIPGVEKEARQEK